MVRLVCHGAYQKAELFKVIPTKEDVSDEFVLYLKGCAVCSSKALEIIRVDIWGNRLKSVRLKSENIDKFLDAMAVIWKPKKLNYMQTASSKFALGYNEYGVEKKCTQNLSNMQLGLIETDPYLDLLSFRGSKAC